MNESSTECLFIHGDGRAILRAILGGYLDPQIPCTTGFDMFRRVSPLEPLSIWPCGGALESPPPGSARSLISRLLGAEWAIGDWTDLDGRPRGGDALSPDLDSTRRKRVWWGTLNENLHTDEKHDRFGENRPCWEVLCSFPPKKVLFGTADACEEVGGNS